MRRKIVQYYLNSNHTIQQEQIQQSCLPCTTHNNFNDLKDFTSKKRYTLKVSLKENSKHMHLGSSNISEPQIKLGLMQQGVSCAQIKLKCILCIDNLQDV